MANYVSKDGLLYFWTLLKSKFVSVDIGVTHTKDTKVGSTTKGVYVDTDGSVKEMTYSLGQSVTSSSKLTDTVTTATTTGSGNAVTSITATNGALTVTKGASYLKNSNDSFTGTLSIKDASGDLCGTIKGLNSTGENSDSGYIIINGSKDETEKDNTGIKIGVITSLTYDPASSSNSKEIATTKWVSDKGYLTSSSTLNATKVSGTLPTSTYTDTKNTAGSTASTSKLFIIGATGQSANPQTYSNANCYIGTDNCLYSNGTKVLTSHQSLSNYYTKTEIDTKLTSAMRYKGSKASVSALPTTGNVTGDMWNVTDTGANYVWDGSAWDETGMVIDLSAYAKTSDLVAVTNSEIDTIVAS